MGQGLNPWPRTATPPTPQQARDALSAARLRSVHPAAGGWPYLQTAMFAMRPVFVADDDTRVKLAAVDEKWRLYINPSTFCALPVREAAAVVMHELLHLLLSYFPTLRRVLADRQLPVTKRAADVVNVAQDLVINQMLAAFSLPEGAVQLANHPGFPADEITEVYFDLLWERVKDQPDLEFAIGWGSPIDGGDGEGEAADGSPLPDSLSEASRLAIGKMVAEAVRAAGNAPGGLKRWADRVLDPLVDWRTELTANLRAGIAAAAGRNEGSRSRKPSRRSHLRPDVVTCARHPVAVRVGLVIDSSGSMGQPGVDSPLEQAAAEARAIIRSVQSSVVVFAVDTAASRVVVSPNGDIPLDGGGGTDMRVGYDALGEAGVAVGVVLTDGHTPWPAAAPDAFTALTVLVGKGVGEPPDWADASPHRVLRTERADS